MKRWVRRILIVILIVAGFGMLLYPNIQRVITAMHQTVAISQYEEGTLRYDEEEKQRELQKAKNYNQQLNGIALADPFGSQNEETDSNDYENILDVELGMMGTLEIPCINVNLPIYHGVSEEVLRKGVGHIQQTAFPIGGEGTHAVLSTHRGLPNARLFSDLDKVKLGDLFYIHIYDEVLAYRVDQIKVVQPENIQYLQPIEGEDHVTLLTCTPYGINSHRLLVRGIRTEYEEEEKEQIHTRVIPSEWCILAGVGLFLCIRIIIGLHRRRKKRRSFCGQKEEL